ncbi:CD1247 N-terminal domain-containing protein [Paramaledivibacter caminithermalis]|jgi:hypothetical protein|uniref:MJ0042 family finger-like domain-containing protein n=1 Tax=Paramaledivibacter caminithermalis (strain DSM 15212 / CIP 107654 / DViRD3) TaxID=1121301 RepID=A0A1M6JRC6_PARC5|nr:CD1247 N-terminal domain-containing protein [Paramaledivibacter caminithermalis]SHJ49241.1 hypothetical protein SAMN02745912_00111 [Paramaledivibacter caminithermalis DSM 15212]
MSYLNERVSYLKGLAEGMELDTNTKEGKLLKNIIDVLEDFADSIDELDDGLAEVNDYVEAIDEDLTDIEDDFYDEFDDEEFIDFDEIKCPVCGEIIYLDEDLLDENDEGEIKIDCPECNETIHITNDDECDCCNH